MIHKLQPVHPTLQKMPWSWLVAGVAGFIGSHLLEALLRLGQVVRRLGGFFSGRQANLNHVREVVGEENWSRFEMIKGDIRDAATRGAASRGVDALLHRAAFGWSRVHPH